MNRRVTAAATAVAAAVGLASCTNDGPTAEGREPIRVDIGVVQCPPIEGYSFPVADHGSADGPSGGALIDAGDSFFDPTCVIEAPPGIVTLTVTNSGARLHSITVPGQGIDVDIAPGETVTVDIELEADGEPLVYFCKYHRTAGMVGAIIAA